LALNGTGLQHVHIILDQLNEALVERAFRRIASRIIWTVSAIAIASLAKASAAMRQRRRQARNCSCRRSAPVIGPRNGEEWQAHILVTGHADCLKPFARLVEMRDELARTRDELYR
jgi:hypothetical protein